jgi:hypothetical protein
MRILETTLYLKFVLHISLQLGHFPTEGYKPILARYSDLTSPTHSTFGIEFNLNSANSTLRGLDGGNQTKKYP